MINLANGNLGLGIVACKSDETATDSQMAIADVEDRPCDMQTLSILLRQAPTLKRHTWQRSQWQDGVVIGDEELGIRCCITQHRLRTG